MTKQQEFRKQTEEAKFEAFSLMCKKVADLEQENERLLKENSELGARIERVITENLELKGEKEVVSCYSDCKEKQIKLEQEIKQLGERCNQLLKDKGNLTDELDERTKDLLNANHRIEQMQDAKCTSCTELGGMQLKINRLEQQIEKMKNCNNCKYGFCSWSSESIDKNGRRTCHAWNKEKQAYCDIGNGSGAKYQLWEIREND